MRPTLFGSRRRRRSVSTRPAVTATSARPGDTQPVRNGREGGIWVGVFAAHAGLVLGLTLLFLIVADLGHAPAGVNLGAGLLLLPLLPLGLPWSVPVIIDPYRFDPAAENLAHALIFAPAALNVVLHGLVLAVFRVVRRRRRAR